MTNYKRNMAKIGDKKSERAKYSWDLGIAVESQN